MPSTSLSSPPTLLQFNIPKSLTGKPSPSLVTVRSRSRFSVAASACAADRSETSMSSLYEVLGIPIGATGEEIKAAYRRLVRSCHPDVTAAVGERKSAGDEFIKVHAAYSTLSDPEKRADYDRRLSWRISPPPPVRPFAGLSASPESSSFCKFPRRNWETDQCW